MTTLIADTSGPYAVIALADGRGEVLSALSFESSRTLSTRLFSGIESVLLAAGATKGGIQALAVGIGPGSFTGVRIALTTFRTMAQAMGLPLVGLVSLDAYAEPVLSLSEQQPVVAVLPSRRGEVYVAVYRNGRRVKGALAETVDELRVRLSESGEKPVLCGRLEIAGDLSDYLVVESRYPAPDALARLAAKRIAAGAFDDPMILSPEYVVPPVITVPRDSSILPAREAA